MPLWRSLCVAFSRILRGGESPSVLKRCRIRITTPVDRASDSLGGTETDGDPLIAHQRRPARAAFSGLFFSLLASCLPTWSGAPGVGPRAQQNGTYATWKSSGQGLKLARFFALALLAPNESRRDLSGAAFRKGLRDAGWRARPSSPGAAPRGEGSPDRRGQMTVRRGRARLLGTNSPSEV